MPMRTALILTFSMVGLANAAVIRVDIDANPNGDGSTWSRAFDSLTDALAVAQPGDQIWVADGKYTPETPAGREATFLIPDGVQLYGGFVGNENTLAQRGDPLDPQVFLDGELGATTNSYHVVTLNGAGSSTVLDGFIITNGVADGSSTANQKHGAGIYSIDSSPTLRNLIVQDCIADSYGGGIYLAGTTNTFAQITDSFIHDNAGSNGGGIRTEIDTIISNTEFLRNTATAGGGLSLIGEEIYLIDNSIFRDNAATISMGGAALVSLSLNSASSVFDQCEFQGNTSPQAGGIGYLFSGTHRITSSRFYANNANSMGSAVRFYASSPASQLTIENTLFTGNTINSTGGVVIADRVGQLFVQGSTFTQNTTLAGGGSGAIMAVGDTVRVDNCILWDNSTPTGNQNNSIFYNLSVDLVVNRTIVQGLGIGTAAPAGVGNIDADPLFVDADGPNNIPGTSDDNVRLTEGSPAIDRGSDLLVSANVLADIYGNSRFLDDTGTPDTGVDDGLTGIVDLGAAEFQGTTPSDCPPDINEDGTLNFFDISAFLTAFNAQDPIADFNDDGTFNFFDISAFLAAFSTGCP